MNIQRSFFLAGLACLLVTGALLYGCSKKSSNPTSPGDGGGGGGNTPFDSGLQSSGFSFPRTFPSEGSVSYFCTPHASSGMTGTVTVSGSTPDSATVTVGPGGTRTFSPASVTVKVGGQVRWVWASSGHTVTSGTPTAATMAMPGMPGMSGHGGH